MIRCSNCGKRIQEDRIICPFCKQSIGNKAGQASNWERETAANPGPSINPPAKPAGFFGKISHTWNLLGCSWEVLKKDKELLIFTCLSVICCLLVLATFAIPLLSSSFFSHAGASSSLDHGKTEFQQGTFYAILFIFYFCNYFVIIFFNSAIVACATIRLRGGDPTLADGFRIAVSRLRLILGWTLVSAVIGMILRIIEDKSEMVGKIASALLGAAWTIASYLVVPLLVNEEMGPFSALKKSTSLLKKSWGEQLLGNLSFGVVSFLLVFPAIFIIFFAFLYLLPNISAIIILLALAALYFFIVITVMSTLESIFSAALYSYLSSGRIPGEFHHVLSGGAIKQQ